MRSVRDRIRGWTENGIQVHHVVGAIAVLGLLFIPFSTVLMERIGIALPIKQFGDFSAYWLAVEKWEHGLPLYSNRNLGPIGKLPFSRTVPYVYPPVVVLLIDPFQFVPYKVGATLWNVMTAGALWLALVILIEEYYPLTWQRRLVLLPLVVLFMPVWSAFRLGQITPLLAAFVTMSAVAMERSRRSQYESYSVLIAVGVTAAGFVKPFILPAGAVLLGRDYRRRLSGAVLTVAVLIGFGVLAVGVAAHFEYLSALLGAKPGNATHVFNIQAYRPGYFEPFDVLGIWAWVPRILLLGAVAGLSQWRMDTIEADRAAFAAGAAVVPLAAPEAYALSFVFYLPAVVVLLAVRREWWPWLLLSVLVLHWHAAAIYYLGEYNVPTETAVFLQPGLYASLLILGAALSLLWGFRRTAARSSESDQHTDGGGKTKTTTDD